MDREAWRVRFMELQRVRHNWATDLICSDLKMKGAVSILKLLFFKWNFSIQKALLTLSDLCFMTNILHVEKSLSVFWKESESHSVVSNSLWPHELYSTWNYPGQKTGMGSLSFLQVIFPTQGLNPGLPQCRQILYQLSHQGNPSFFGLYQLNCPEGLWNPLQCWC